MIRLVRPGFCVSSDHAGDVRRLQEALFVGGYDASASDVEWAWQEYSDGMCAGWMMCSSYLDGDLVSIIRERLVPVDVPENDE